MICSIGIKFHIGEDSMRILIAKGGLDGHDRGAKIVSRSLRDAGHEVIYTGLHQSAKMIVDAAIQEDVDLIGISILSGAHMGIFRKILELLKQRKCEIPVFGGGIIPLHDATEIETMGVRKVFGPGTTTSEIVLWVRDNIG